MSSQPTPSTATTQDLLQRLKQLEEAVAVANAQSVRYAEDLRSTYQRSQEQERELQDINGLLMHYANDLTATVVELRRTNAELEQSYRDTIMRLVTAAEYKDRDTGAHIARIAHYSVLMAQACGLRHDLVVSIEHASPMHDIGKIGIPDHILTKPGKLTAEEYELIKTHTTIGSRILSGSTAAVLRMAEEIARCHHERWDGDGYPQGLRGGEIPIAARIVGLVDTFDALTSVRPYKGAMPVDIAAQIVREESGCQFDPELVELFVSRLDDIRRIQAREGNGG